jgi:hypothetical protein
MFFQLWVVDFQVTINAFMTLPFLHAERDHPPGEKSIFIVHRAFHSALQRINLLPPILTIRHDLTLGNSTTVLSV